MKQIIDTINKTISVHMDEKDEDLTLLDRLPLSKYVADGYRFRLFDIKGRLLYSIGDVEGAEEWKND